LKAKLTLVTIGTILSALLIVGLGSLEVSGWSNGGYSGNPLHPDYGTHDWIAQHALDFLPAQEKQFYAANLESYLYGTELPDNAQAPDGVGDTSKHHIYFNSNGSLQDDSAAVRAEQEYVNAQNAFGAGNLSAVSEHLGMVAHYISDVSVFGHVMGASTPWGSEKHHSDYEDYVLTKTTSYDSPFNSFLIFDGNLTFVSAQTTAIAVARDTTFDANRGLTCIWMDQNYNWSSPIFTNRVGESLNLATNSVADVLHTFYLETVNVTPEFPFYSITVLTLLMVVCLITVFFVKKCRSRNN
jgi:hypothetical protein